MKFKLLFILLAASSMSNAQNISIQQLVDTLFCGEIKLFHGEKLYFLNDNVPEVLSTVGKSPKCLSLIKCVTEKELLKCLRWKKQLNFLAVKEVKDSFSENHEAHLILTLSILRRKGNVKKVRTLIFQDRFEVIIAKHPLTDDWQISKLIYPPRIESTRNFH
jgi:hypothetical protein